MTAIGTLESLWRYPVKSMRGEKLEQGFVGFSGLYGDRLYAFASSAAPAGFPYFTAREQEAMLLYRPFFRDPAKAVQPPNLAEARAIAPGITPLYPEPDELAVAVETPAGPVLAVEDPALIEELRQGVRAKHGLTLVRSARALTDCRPVSLFSLATVRRLAEESGARVDKRQFRANLYLDLDAAAGFAENGYIGKRLQIGPEVTLAVLERDPRCKMITLDPDSGRANPALLKTVTEAHEGKAGLYAAVIAEGTVRPGDRVSLLDA